MSETDYEKLEKSLERLREQYENFGLDKKGRSRIDKEAIKESVIKRFDICFDTLIKHLRKFMEEQLGMSEIRDHAIEIFRKARQSGIIDSEMQEQLNNYRKIRNNSAHSYSEEEAQKTLDIIDDFIEDVSEIYQTMVNWE